MSSPALMLVGDIPLVTPEPLNPHDPKQVWIYTRIGLAEMRLKAGQRKEGARLVLSIESDLGVTAADRIAAMARVDEEWEGDLEQILGLLGESTKDPSAPSRKTTLPANERGMTEAQLRRFDKLKRKLKLTTLNDRQRTSVLEEVARIEQSARDEAEINAVEAGLADTKAQAVAQGEPLKADAKGRMSRQTSLDSLVASCAISVVERTAGEMYGEIFGAASLLPSLKVADWGATGGGDSDAVADRFQEIKDAQKAAEVLDGKDGKGGLHAYVASRVPAKRAVWILKLVAGQGRRISHIRMGGAGRARSTKALQLALAALADKWGLQ